MRRKRVRRNPSYRRRRRSNPSSTRINPGGISSMVMGGVWVGAGMWLGGIINGFLPSFGGGMIMELLRGVGTAYIVGMVAGRFTHNAGLMAAGAFAPTAMGLLSSVLGGVTGGLSSIAGGIGGGGKQPQQVHSSATVPVGIGSPTVVSAPSNVAQFPQAG